MNYNNTQKGNSIKKTYCDLGKDVEGHDRLIEAICVFQEYE